MRQEVIIYICLEWCRPGICVVLYWVPNLIQETWFLTALRQTISLCYLVTPSQPDSSSVALTCCAGSMPWDCRCSNTCIGVSHWDLAWSFHVCLTESILFNLYVMKEVETKQYFPELTWVANSHENVAILAGFSELLLGTESKCCI